MSVVLFAYHDDGCRTAEVLTELGVEISCVYTHRDDPRENTWFGSVAATASGLGIPVRHADPRTAAERDHIRALAPRALFSAYWRHLLPDEVLALAPVAVNLHGSLLPRYRGRAPANWQIMHGEREGGVSLHHMVREPDAGDLMDQQSFPIGPDDTPRRRPPQPPARRRGGAAPQRVAGDRGTPGPRRSTVAGSTRRRRSR